LLSLLPTAGLPGDKQTAEMAMVQELMKLSLLP
jgi:hypothetical protein